MSLINQCIGSGISQLLTLLQTDFARHYSVSTVFFFFFFNATAPPEIYTLSLHDALPISDDGKSPLRCSTPVVRFRRPTPRHPTRSEEHTSELQSPYDLVCRLLLEKKKNRT